MSMLIWLLIFLLVLMHLKTSRADGTLVKNVHPYRRLMWHIMPTRKDSIVYADDYIEAENLLQYLETAKTELAADITHCIVGATALALANVPELNRFIVGRRLYKRRGRFISFSVKRVKNDRKAKMAVVKLFIPKEETFLDLCKKINAEINKERSGKKTYADKEFAFFTLLPRSLLNIAVCFSQWLDYHNCLPKTFIKSDPLYTSCIIANIGSLNMDPGYHHLYEWGNCPFFVLVGKIIDQPVWQESNGHVNSGQFVRKKMLHIRYTYDERIEDALTVKAGLDLMKKILENPFQFLGCTQADKTDICLLNQNIEP